MRRDAPEGGQGKPCGKSHIPKDYKCSRGSATTNSSKNLGIAPVALAAAGLSVAAVVGIAALAHHSNKSHTTKTLRNNVNQEQKDALYDYVLSSYGLNRNLRTGKAITDERQAKIMKHIDDWFLTADRAAGTYYRGIPHSARSEWSTVKAGDVIQDKAYVSFSGKYETGEKFAEGDRPGGPGVIIVARGGAAKIPYNLTNSFGKAIASNDTIAREDEYLLPRGTIFTVKRTREVAVRVRKGLTFNLRFVYVDIGDPPSS